MPFFGCYLHHVALLFFVSGHAKDGKPPLRLSGCSGKSTADFAKKYPLVKMVMFHGSVSLAEGKSTAVKQRKLEKTMRPIPGFMSMAGSRTVHLTSNLQVRCKSPRTKVLASPKVKRAIGETIGENLQKMIDKNLAFSISLNPHRSENPSRWGCGLRPWCSILVNSLKCLVNGVSAHQYDIVRCWHMLMT